MVTHQLQHCLRRVFDVHLLVLRKKEDVRIQPEAPQSLGPQRPTASNTGANAATLGLAISNQHESSKSAIKGQAFEVTASPGFAVSLRDRFQMNSPTRAKHAEGPYSGAEEVQHQGLGTEIGQQSPLSAVGSRAPPTAGQSGQSADPEPGKSQGESVLEDRTAGADIMPRGDPMGQAIAGPRADSEAEAAAGVGRKDQACDAGHTEDQTQQVAMDYTGSRGTERVVPRISAEDNDRRATSFYSASSLQEVVYEARAQSGVESQTQGPVPEQDSQSSPQNGAESASRISLSEKGGRKQDASREKRPKL